jgi:hypothetical protein
LKFKKSIIAAVVATACGLTAAQNITQGAGFSGGADAQNDSSNGVAIGRNANITASTSPTGDMPDVVIGASTSSTGSYGVVGPTGILIGGGPNTAVGAYARTSNSSAGSAFGAGARVATRDGSAIINATAIGANTEAYGNGATVLGIGSGAGMNATSIGQNASADAESSIAIGICTNSTCTVDPVTGVFTKTTVQNGIQSIAIGQGSLSGGIQAMALGAFAEAGGTSSVAIGAGSKASNNNSIALGAKTTTNRDDSVAVGGRQITDVAAGTTGNDAVNLNQLNQGVAGAVSQANTYSDTQLTGGTVNANFATMTTGGVKVNTNSAIDMGENVVHGVAAGTAGTDAVNLNQLNQGVAGAASQANAYSDTQLTGGTVTANFATVTTGGVKVNANSTIDMGNNIVHGVAAGIAGTDAVNVDQFNQGLSTTLTQATTYTDIAVTNGVAQAKAYTNDAIANSAAQSNTYTDQKTQYFNANSTGAASSATGKDSIAIGPGTVTNGNSSIAGGLNAKASADDAVVFGSNSNGSAAGAVAIGSASRSSDKGAVAVGQGATGAGAGAVAVGQASAASATNAVAIGQGALATEENSVALGAGSMTTAAVAVDKTTINGSSYNFAGAKPSSTVSVGSVGVERQITNVAAGRVTSTSTDAINGSQLAATNQAVDTLGNNVNSLGTSTSSVLGGGSTYDPTTGKISAPSYTVGGTIYNSVGGALGAVTSRLDSSIASNSTNKTPAVVTGANSVAIGAGSVADRANTVSFGAPGAERVLTNVAAGVQDTDATNLGQVRTMVNNGTAASNAYTDRQLAALDAKTQKQMSAVGAMAMATSALQPNARAEGNVSISAAAGTYGGEGALAAGVNYQVSNQVVVNARIGLTSSGPAKVGAAVGATWGF